MSAERVLPSSIALAIEREIVVKKSRFIAHIAPVGSLAEAESVIASVRKARWDAGHHCVALRLGTAGDQQRSSDDGEPSGTAGIPMLEVLLRRDLTDVVAIVTRYFGGVLLGAGGLVRAYSGAVVAALDEARMVRRALRTQVVLDVSHADAGRIEHWLREWTANHDSVLADARYTSNVQFTVLADPRALADLTAEVAALTSGTVTPRPGDSVVATLG